MKEKLLINCFEEFKIQGINQNVDVNLFEQDFHWHDSIIKLDI